VSRISGLSNTAGYQGRSYISRCFLGIQLLKQMGGVLQCLRFFPHVEPYVVALRRLRMLFGGWGEGSGGGSRGGVVVVFGVVEDD